MCIHAKLLQSCTILCNLMDCSPPGSSVHGILQARILVWVAIPFSRGSSQPRDRTCIFCIVGRFFTAEPSVRVLVTQSCLTLGDPMDCSLPGSSVHVDSPGKNTGVSCHFLLQGIFPTKGSNPHLLCLPDRGFFISRATWETHNMA